MKKNTGIRKVVSVLACLTLTMSAMVSAFGLEVAPTVADEKRDITSLTFGGCRTEAAEEYGIMISAGGSLRSAGI